MRKLLAGGATLAWLTAASLAFSADVPAAPAVEPPTFRLPSGARPLRYDVALTLVPGEAKAPGEIAIQVELDRPHPVLWLNADTLSVTSAATELPETRVTVLSGHEQFVGLAFEPPLAAGRHRVTLTFEAEQSRNSTRGIFALQDSGAWYAMTQFEATSARRAFPCFDEPGFKTPWVLTLRVPRDLTALSNTPVVSEANVDDGLKTVRFAQTRPLPTYLVAFAVGPWEFVDLGRVGVNRTPTRIVVPRGRLADTEFVSRAYPQLFERLETWFGMPYPFEKLDHVVIPITVNFAMENVGLITYAAPVLLALPGAATPRFRRGAANVGTHEIAHQWFGNLVTTAWWDDIWLNEAFATWIAAKIVNEWRPDYDRGAARIDERAKAIDADALASSRQIREPVNSRSDIFNAFDSITYEKGATVIGMFEGWVGEEPFRSGVRDYLESRRDGSATAEDFLQSLTKASRLPLAPAFNTFLNQNGVPHVDVRLQCEGGGAKLALTQHRLELLGSNAMKAQQWQIPVCARYGTRTSSRQACTLMTEVTKTIPLSGGCPAYVFANAAGRGYYVPDYRGGLLTKIANHRSALSAAEYASLLYDLKVLVRAGAVSSAQAMLWVRYGASAADRHVVLAALDLAELAGNTLFADADRPKFSAFVREVFGPRAKALGFAPKANENDDDQLLRRALLRFVAPEDPSLAAEARRLALVWIRDRKAVDPGLIDAVLVTAGRTGDSAMFDALLAEAKATQDRLDRRYLMMALFAFTHPALAQKGMALLLDPAFDVRESWTSLHNGFYWNPARRVTNDFIMANFDALAKTVGRDTPGGWPVYASGLCSETELAEVEAFWKERVATYAGAGRELAQAAEAIQACTRVRAHAKFGTLKN
ncbi:MAG: M1 family metallopeptidase [Pseudomonadota bacterium]|nr:M1 family metallopeptidase [Pseudomonadota bacterium]